MNRSVWCVYLILCQGGALYCGISNRAAERFQAHLKGRGAKFTRSRKPLEMRIIACCLDKNTALSRENAVKKLPAAAKRRLWAQAAASSSGAQAPRSATHPAECHTAGASGRSR